MKLTIEHTTHYQYEKSVRQSIQYLRLTPKDSKHQKIVNWQLTAPGNITETTDAYGNILHVMTLDEPHDDICIKVKGEVEIIQKDLEDADRLISPYAYLRTTELTKADHAIKLFSDEFVKRTATLSGLSDMMKNLLILMPYSPGSTKVYDSAAVAFEKNNGVCQDHTHVFLSACRHNDLPARYVSGYIYTPDINHVASHAWAEVWLDGQWHTFDVTNGLTSPDQHIKLAVGLDYLDACPVRGVRTGGGDESMLAVAKVGKVSLSLASQQ
jgi:transglutaminase-like putative cysteine protease